MPTDEQVHLAVESFRMLADPTRVKLLWALLQGESSVSCLAELVGASPTTISQHLAKLRLAGLVRGRREGTFVYYIAADEHVRALLAEALFHAEHTDRGLPENTEHRHQPAPTQPSSTSLHRSEDEGGTKHLTGGSSENDPVSKHVVVTSVNPSGGHRRSEADR